MAEPTREDLIYNAWRAAIGKDGTVEGMAPIVELERRVCARAIAAVADMGERSALQAFPDHAMDLLPYYERLLGLTDDPDLTEDERRAEAAALYTLEIASDVPGMEAALQQLDARFDIVLPAASRATVTLPGRAFEDMDADEPFGGGRQSTLAPNYSSMLVLRVVLELGDGVQPNATERRTMKTARKLLHDVLPATNDLQIGTHRGFRLDVSRLDLTSFGG